MDAKKKKILLKKNEVITEEVLSRIPSSTWKEISLLKEETLEQNLG